MATQPDDDRQVCFVIGPIGSQGSPERKNADLILTYMIKPIVEPKGFRAIRADEIAEPGLVSRQVMRLILDSPLVIADLTDRNPNVYYELAVRHAIRKPLVQLINGKPPLPFDVVDTRTIFFDLTDLGSVEDAKVKLGQQVDAALHNPRPMENPIAETLDLESYRTSGDSTQVAFAQLLAAVSDLRGEFRAAQTAWATPMYVPVQDKQYLSTPQGFSISTPNVYVGQPLSTGQILYSSLVTQPPAEASDEATADIERADEHDDVPDETS